MAPRERRAEDMRRMIMAAAGEERHTVKATIIVPYIAWHPAIAAAENISGA